MSKTEVPSDYAARIRRLRGVLGLTQVQLAQLMGVSFASVNRWENGQARPSPLAWEKILRAEEVGIEGFSAEEARGESMGLREPASGSPGRSEEPLTHPDMDFSEDAEIVRVVAEAHRLSHGHLFNPTFATETSLVEPLPHQYIAVYERMLPQPRLRFLLADDAGAGKTIMTGLYMREMLSRRVIRRILVVPPAGLVGNWEREMRTLFGLRFRIVTGVDARTSNPFIGPNSDLIIVSVDTLAGERVFSRLRAPGVSPYDLVVFDEAHKLSAGRDRDLRLFKTDRYCLAEALAGVPDVGERWSLAWSCRHVLLLTATPHMGHDFPYFCLWRLLEPGILTTIDAFNEFPREARRRHFLRRTKEEMVRLDGTRIYPTRVSDTLSYDLTQGDVSEQALYDALTTYVRVYYNRARILNRSAARLAMSVFQRRAASSTYALLRSIEKRLEKLDKLIRDVRTGGISLDDLAAKHGDLDEGYDVLEGKTADEEEAREGLEENEIAEEKTLGAVVATSLGELEAERVHVEGLLDLARQVYEAGNESKFEKLAGVVRDPRFKDDKMIIFTEYRDTLDFLVQRFEALGFTGKVARIHGGMDYLEREREIEFFRKPAEDGGALYLVATDAAGEGVNLQFCRLMVNYDIPWNPARLEQRMGRIHRYGQRHDPVYIVNLVAGKTREGRVLKTLLDKLENIRRELGSDKVFDVVGRLFEGISLRQYMEQIAVEGEPGAEALERKIEWTITKEQVKALGEREKRLFGDGGDVKRELPRVKGALEREVYGRLLPGYVRGFVDRASPLMGLGVEGNLDGFFAFRARKPRALDPLLPLLETYPPETRERLTVHKPADEQPALFLRPGEPFFDHFRDTVCRLFGQAALKGGVFIDPTVSRPYVFHLASVEVRRLADDEVGDAGRSDTVEVRLVGLRQTESGDFEECPVEHLLLLKEAQGIPPSAVPLALRARQSVDSVRAFVREQIGRALVQVWRGRIIKDLPEREEFVRKGFDYYDAELAAARSRYAEKAALGDVRARLELQKVKERQRVLAGRRDEALARLRREPELVVPGEVVLLAHALVVPASEPEDAERYDRAVEAVAVKVSVAYEEAAGAVVKDVSTPEGARAAGLGDRPGFDLLSRRRSGEERAIEVKGRASTGDIELTENEWARACNLRDRYWLYVVYDCATPYPRLLRIRDPFGSLFVHRKGGVVVDEAAVFAAAEGGA